MATLMDKAPEKQACDVFVSHRGTLKRGVISQVVQRLQRANLDVFVDYNMIKGVDAWALILAKLRGAHRILLVLSPGFEESPWCLEEARIAAERCVAVLPVFLDREPRDVDEALLQRAWQELRQERPGASATTPELWRTALGCIGGVAGWVHRSGTECVALLSCETTASTVGTLCICSFCKQQTFTFGDHKRAHRSYESELVDKVQAHLLRVFRPLGRMPAESEVGLDAQVTSLKEVLRTHKVRNPHQMSRAVPFICYVRAVPVRGCQSSNHASAQQLASVCQLPPVAGLQELGSREFHAGAWALGDGGHRQDHTCFGAV